MKIFIVGLFAFMLGAGVFWGYNNYQKVLKENDELKKINQEIPSSVDSNTVFPSNVPSPTVSQELGSIKGTLGYPSSFIPPLEVYLFDKDNEKKYYMIETNTNQTTFEIKDLDPGTYYAIAYVKDGNNANFAGGYTKMVPCGLSVECTDHSLIPVEVIGGATVTEVEIKDWYAPEGFFPKKP